MTRFFLLLLLLFFDLGHRLQEEAAFSQRVAVRVSVLLAVFALHEHVAILALDQWVVTGLDRMDIKLLTRRLVGQVAALAELVGDLVLVN